MAFINIQTNNLTRELRNSTTFIDNWAYVPGTAITGDWKQPYAFTSLDDFKSQFGTKSPEGSITFEYVSGLLNSGIPVLFRRIACTNQDTAQEQIGVEKASVILTHHVAEPEEQDINDVKITEKFGGTFGNTMSITIRNTGIAYWIEVYSDYTLLERQKLIAVSTTDDEEVINTKLIEALKSAQFERIDVEVLNEDPTSFRLEPVTGKQLTGGSDFDEDLVSKEIPKSYEYIKDKILYQPKFITSGGYTDTDVSQTSSMASAMKELTLLRQDCRALIDLPLGTPPEEYQTLAGQVGYQQLSNTQKIPSASMCGPWQYMQVGNSQVWMPPSYVYLTVLGSALSAGEAVYTPKAGISSGQVANIIRSEFDIGSDLSEQWQSDTTVNINPIMRLQGGRYVIAGNSTLLIPDAYEGENNAFSESSSDLAVIEIRRFVYNLATELQYQYNSLTAFENFALQTSNFLDTMKNDGAVTDYVIANESSDEEPRKLKIRLDVSLTPTIKDIDIMINISYGSVEVTTGGEA